MRKLYLASVLALALGSGRAYAQAQTPDAGVHILVGGVHASGGGPVSAGDRAAIQRIINDAYQHALKQSGGTSLTHADLKAIAAQVTQALRQAGYSDAQAYLSDRFEAFALPGSGEGGALRAAKASSTLASGNVVPPVSDRTTQAEQGRRIAVSGFSISGVGDHPVENITPDSIQKLLDDQYEKLGGTKTRPAQVTFQQLQDVAQKVTDRYRKEGFIVATAFLPAQTLDNSRIVQIRVLEGQIGRVIVQGTKRYRPWVISAPARKLRGRVLRKSDVDTALLYDRDLPGVSVTSTFQPGEHTGLTDLVMLAHEARRPVQFSVGANNYGTSLTGRYRLQAGATWNAPLGIGDTLSTSVDYGLDPQQNTYGSLVYRIPTVVVPGLNGVVGGTRSSLQISTGPFAKLGVKGPSQLYFAGADWKFVNHTDLKMQSSLHFIHEESKLSSLGTSLSDERFDVAALGLTVERTDHRFHGIDLLSIGVRKSIRDNSRTPDLVSPDHARSFLTERLSYTRLQFLTTNQRLYFKLVGQYTRNALAPLEQFSIGGPDSVRAYPIADALRDRGYYTSLEYHVNAPGFANVISPFYHRPWRELLELETFVDFARAYPAGADRSGGSPAVTYEGIGTGVIFRLPRFHQLEFHFDISKPVGSQEASDGKGYHIYSRFGLKF